jgi:hypothetical protein
MYMCLFPLYKMYVGKAFGGSVGWLVVIGAEERNCGGVGKACAQPA